MPGLKESTNLKRSFEGTEVIPACLGLQIVSAIQSPVLLLSSLGTSQVPAQDPRPSPYPLLKRAGLEYNHLPADEEVVIPDLRSLCGQRPSDSSSGGGLLMAGVTTGKEGRKVRLL